MVTIGAKAKARGNSTQNRRVFPGEHFFEVPLRLYESGFAAHLSGSEFKRYVTFLRLANWNYGRAKLQVDLEELEALDGVSARTALMVHTKLQKFGMVEINKTTKPLPYSVSDPCWWEPPPELQRRNFERAGRIRVKTEFAPIVFKKPV